MKASPLFLAILTAGCAWAASEPLPAKIGFHPAVYDDSGKLLAWTQWADALDREMNWYAKCPVNDKGYPHFAYMTFMDGNYEANRMDSIPATQNGLAIISYIKYWEFKGRSDAGVIRRACQVADYLLNETLTPNRGVYPRYTRSTGYYMDMPLFRSAQGDARYTRHTIQPDKGGIAGYALLRLFEATGEKRYLRQARHNAQLLAKNMRPGDAAHSPWPFRVDSITGERWGERCGNVAYTLRLFDALLARGEHAFQAPRDALWQWIVTCLFNTPDDPQHCLWVQFFEDYDLDTNRNSWAPLEMARYLIEAKEQLDPEWKTHAEKLIQFAMRNFSSTRPGGVTVMGEQDDDKDPWGGACAKLGGVAALFYAAGGGSPYKEIAFRNLNWMTYFIDSDGCPGQKADVPNTRRGGWQEDCHTDVVHNFVDAMTAVPEFR